VSNPSQPGSQHRYRRRRITWPVTVQADARRLHGETLDVGPQGAKLRLTERPDVGTCITLHLTPIDGDPMAIEAIVWRHDEEGVVVFFLSTETGIWERERRHTGAGTGELSSKPTETILVVDDDAEVLDVVGDSLETVGYKVLRTADPFEALGLARRGALPIHLLLTDVVMPLMHGVKLADEFRAIRLEAKVLFMSAYVTAEVEDHGAVLVPGVSLLIKPFGLPVLHDRVRSALDFRSPVPVARIS
jgi:CheY-like chemotaxis protein